MHEFYLRRWKSYTIFIFNGRILFLRRYLFFYYYFNQVFESWQWSYSILTWLHLNPLHQQLYKAIGKGIVVNNNDCKMFSNLLCSLMQIVLFLTHHWLTTHILVYSLRLELSNKTPPYRISVECRNSSSWKIYTFTLICHI